MARQPSEHYDAAFHHNPERQAPSVWDVLGHLLDAPTTPRGSLGFNTPSLLMLREVSGGAFELCYSGRYSYSHRLAVCCAQAIREFAEFPCTPAIRADIMGRAMELLREKHGVNAPRGWYPAMKQLRGITSAGHQSQPSSPHHRMGGLRSSGDFDWDADQSEESEEPEDT